MVLSYEIRKLFRYVSELHVYDDISKASSNFGAFTFETNIEENIGSKCTHRSEKTEKDTEEYGRLALVPLNR